MACAMLAPAPAPKYVPAAWDYDKVRLFPMESGTLITAKEAVRMGPDPREPVDAGQRLHHADALCRAAVHPCRARAAGPSLRSVGAALHRRRGARALSTTPSRLRSGTLDARGRFRDHADLELARPRGRSRRGRWCGSTGSMISLVATTCNAGSAEAGAEDEQAVITPRGRWMRSSPAVCCRSTGNRQADFADLQLSLFGARARRWPGWPRPGRRMPATVAKLRCLNGASGGCS